MARVNIEVSQKREHTISAIDAGDVPAQQIDHAAPVVLRNPVAIVQAHHRGRVYPVAIMEVVIGQAGVAAETCRIPDQTSPITVVIEKVGVLTGGGKPEL